MKAESKGKAEPCYPGYPTYALLSVMLIKTACTVEIM